MIDDVLKAAVGIGLRKLRATQDTFLKRSPVQSSDLIDTEKLFVVKGFEIVVSACTVENSHYAIECADSCFMGKGYAFMGHFAAIGGVDVAKKVI